MIDSHCHLDFNVFNNNREEILASAQAHGVTRILNPAVDVATSQAIVDMVAGLEGIYAAVGVHPHDASALDSAMKSKIERALTEPGVVAVGEIGLERHAVQRWPGPIPET